MEYTVGEILRVTEKELAPVSCLAEGAPECERKAVCKTIEFWNGLDETLKAYLNSKTLADRM